MRAWDAGSGWNGIADTESGLEEEICKEKKWKAPEVESNLNGK